MKQVVVAYDGSAPARRALRHGADLVRPGDGVLVVNVMPEPGISARLTSPVEEHDRQSQVLDEAVRLLAGHGIEARTEAAVGNAATEILAAAERVAADVIVVARHSGRLSHVLGSTSAHVVRSAPCDVLVVHGA